MEIYMPALDQSNHAKFWTDGRLAGMDLIHASYTTLEFAPHAHEEFVIAVTEDGAGKYRSNNKSDIAPPNTVLVFNPGEIHSGGVANGKLWRYRALYMSPSFCNKCFSSLSENGIGLPYFVDNKIIDPGLAAHFLLLHQECEQGAGRLELESRLLAALAILAQRHGRASIGGDTAAGLSARMRAVRDYIHAEYPSDISVDDLATLAGLSQFHFIRAFRRQFHFSPSAYLNQVRLREARRMLADGNSAAETAAAAGFYDQSHLTKHFKRTYGITPKQYATAVSASERR
jgi:AraC-like DNA-binding protein